MGDYFRRTSAYFRPTSANSDAENHLLPPFLRVPPRYFRHFRAFTPLTSASGSDLRFILAPLFY